MGMFKKSKTFVDIICEWILPYQNEEETNGGAVFGIARAKEVRVDAADIADAARRRRRGGRGGKAKRRLGLGRNNKSSTTRAYRFIGHRISVACS